jgi:hypothetical protein
LLFAAGMAVVAGGAAGIPPALKATTGALEAVLRDESSGASALSFGRFSAALLVAQVTISVAFLSVATLVALGLYQQGKQDFGVPEGEVVVAQIYWRPPAEPAAGETPADFRDRFRRRADSSRGRIEERLERLTGVVAASSATGVPGQAWIGWTDSRHRGRPERRERRRRDLRSPRAQ